jgi:hypothetical protein
MIIGNEAAPGESEEQREPAGATSAHASGFL